MTAADERMVFFDTNILLYSISRDAAEAEKRERAIALLDRDDGALSVQVLQEFYVQATRPSRPARLSHDLATGLIRRWTRFPVQELNLSILNSEEHTSELQSRPHLVCRLLLEKKKKKKQKQEQQKEKTNKRKKKKNKKKRK